MAKVDTRALRSPRTPDRLKAPSVLVILVARNGAAWLPQCLIGLSRQTHPRIGVLAVDNASNDGSADLLESALGAERVIRLDRSAGFAGAVGRGMAEPVARRADFVMLLHDDTILAPDAVERLLEVATRVSGVGVVGPKVLDSEDPQVLRDIGLSTDRFGYPYSPLEEGEIDQGQYDRIREVRFVSSCAMLISREALARVGVPDERLTSTFEDLDFCWRAQLAGFRVLMTPGAVAHHRGATVRKERMGTAERSRGRYDRERAALLCMLKNYGALSLIWILPFYLTIGLARIAGYALTRRFGDAAQVLAAWGWNLQHLPGTVRRRVRAQAVRVVPDRSVRRSMAPPGIRFRRWTLAAAQILARRPSEEAELPLERSVSRRALGLVRSHPVLTSWAAAVFLALLAYRHLFGVSPIAGGAVAAFPGSPSGFFRELVSGLRHTGLGGSQAASPALGLLGTGSVLALGSPGLLQKVLILGLPAAAAVGCYRAVRPLTGDRVPAVVAAACYGLSSSVLWALSEGRLGALVLLAGVPWLASKIPFAFDPGSRVRTLRWVGGAAAGVAVLASFYPGVLLSAGVLTATALVSRRERKRRGRGIALVVLAVGVGAILLFPLTLVLIRAGSGALADPAGRPSFFALARLSPGPAPGAWMPALYLPLAAALSLVFVSRHFAGPAVRAALAALVALYLAWLGAAGYLPTAVSNPIAYLAVAAFAYATLVGLGLTSLTRGVARASFGSRQFGVVLMTAVLAVGLGAQAFQAARGAWAIGGPERIPPAFLVVQQSAGPYRVLWLGQDSDESFPAPGGVSQGTVAAGSASVRFAVTGPGGASALDIARPSTGPGYEALDQALHEILAGPTRHGGALLAPFGIRYVLAGPRDLPRPAQRALAAQLDLDSVPTNGLTIFRDPKAVPVASVVGDRQWAGAAFVPRSATRAQELPEPRARPLPGGEPGTTVPSPGEDGTLILLADQFDSRWSLRPSGGQAVPPRRAFGWATAFQLPSSTGSFDLQFGGQGVRRLEIGLLILLWAGVLWVTRRPVRG